LRFEKPTASIGRHNRDLFTSLVRRNFAYFQKETKVRGSCGQNILQNMTYSYRHFRRSLELSQHSFKMEYNEYHPLWPDVLRRRKSELTFLRNFCCFFTTPFLEVRGPRRHRIVQYTKLSRHSFFAVLHTAENSLYQTAWQMMR